ncbi:MAG: hypothetical protein ACXABY_27935 [Candidatus Thorarchaeota archaeon]|jgi:hypothetical protein
MPLDFKPVKCDKALEKLGIHSNDYRLDFVKISREIRRCIDTGDEHTYINLVSALSRDDFFFFCYFVLDLPVNEPFLIARVYEVQDKAHMTIDLWAREHWKSTLLTFARPLWELILNKEERICIFSHTRSMAKAHMRKIKLELENNEILWTAFPDVFYKEPKQASPKWSEDDGLYVKSKRNEAAIEAWGLIEKMPTGKHFTIRIYDDIITETAVQTKGQLEKVERQFRLTEPLGTRGGTKRVIGTRYSHKDLYGTLLSSKHWESRVYPAEVGETGNAMRHGTPVYKTEKELEQMYDVMGEYIYGAQMLQDPTAEGMRKFKRVWLRTWSQHTRKPYMNVYILVDPATTEETPRPVPAMEAHGCRLREDGCRSIRHSIL